MDELGTVLGVWAHPDDETYLMAGLMARAVRNGSRVVCVTATRGEGGSTDEERWPSSTMGAVRVPGARERPGAAGRHGAHWLDHLDVDMDTPLDGTGYAQVLALVEEVRPDSILTFGPDGMTGHAAHMSVCDWSTRAHDAAGSPGSKLYYATTTPEWAATWVPIYNRFDVFRPGTPPVTPREETAILYELPPEDLELKLRAIEEHRSQVGAMVDAFGEDIFRQAMADEVFRLAAVKG